MVKRSLVVVGCLALMASLASASMPPNDDGGALANSIWWIEQQEFTDVIRWPVYDLTGTQLFWPVYGLNVTQKVFVGVDGQITEGLYKYRWDLDNDGGAGMGSPVDAFFFTEDLDAVPILDHRADGTWGPWLFTLVHDSLTNAPKWSTEAGGIQPDKIGYFEIVTPGTPDRLYDAMALDGTTYSVGQTTGPTPEPCTLALMGLGLSGAGIIRLIKRRRE